MRSSLAFSVQAVLVTLPFVLGDTTKAFLSALLRLALPQKTPYRQPPTA